MFKSLRYKQCHFMWMIPHELPHKTSWDIMFKSSYWYTLSVCNEMLIT